MLEKENNQGVVKLKISSILVNGSPDNIRYKQHRKPMGIREGEGSVKDSDVFSLCSVCRIVSKGS